MNTGYLIGNWSRFYVVDEQNRSLARTELKGSVKDCNSKIQELRQGYPPPEVVGIVKKALKAVDVVATEDAKLASQLQKIVDGKIIFLRDDIFRQLRLMFFRKGINTRHALALHTAFQDKRVIDAQPDMVICRLVDMLTTYDSSYQFYENYAQNWHNDRFADRITYEKETLNENPFRKEERIIQDIDNLLKDLAVLQKETKKALASLLKTYAYNLYRVAGPIIGARLIAEVGSLKQLSLLSAGSIQVLGAGKALSRARYYNADPPKYGIIFSHPLVQRLPPEHRGKMARALSCQIAIASRADQYTQNDIAAQLVSKIKARFSELG